MYRVTWTIDIDAKTPWAAAHKALAIHRNPESIATVFDVTTQRGRTVRVDLGQKERNHVQVRQLRAVLRARE